MTECFPTIAVHPALTPQDIQDLSAGHIRAAYEPASVESSTFSDNTLFVTPFGKNAFTQTVVSWLNEEQHTVLGFDPSGLVDQRLLHNREDSMPTADEMHLALTKIAEYIRTVKKRQATIQTS